MKMETQKVTARGTTISERVQFWGITEPNNAAFIFWGPTGRFVLSRGEIFYLSSRFAYRLNQHGVKPGDVVCSTLPNSPERVVVDFGVQLAGGIPMNGQILRADGQDLLESMKMAQCKMMIVDPDITGGAWNICKQYFNVTDIEGNLGHLTCRNVPSLTMVEFCKSKKPEMMFLQSLQTEDKLVTSTQESDTAYLFTTSGTSGFTKIVPHTHKTLLRMAEKKNKFCIQTRETDKYCCCGPLGWLGGFPFNFLHPGCPRVLFDYSNGDVQDRPQMLWKMISTEAVQVAFLMPVDYMAIYRQAEIWKPLDFRLKRVLSAGQPVRRENLAIIAYLTESVFCFYASTELGHISGMDFYANNISSFQESNAGYPFDGVDVRVVDAAFADVKSGSRGEIIVRCDTLCRGYVGHEQSCFLPDGWFRTDDVGYMTKDGVLTIEGRSSDAIMHGAYILYPYWLEKKLSKCPGVKQVVIVPVPDPVLYHEICACIISDKDADVTAQHVIDFCKSEMDVNIVSSMKFIPKYVLTFESFPLTKTSKLDRKKTARTARQLLNL